ncbi:phage tail protein [Cryptosporangium phraense]|uniref:Phage tail protein n=1 Tax=Cryptosporangium phraense TaxID=2593070 RepID=A0A545APX7_9ACTN|nr:phage tail protein [Cryptosporangium phraense]TQS43388.1 phage tail protein [Cryptosporangium phraense]
MRRRAIERLLPAAYQRAAVDGSVLAALLDVMEALHEPDEALIDDVDRLFTPYLTTDDLVPFLARWVALDHLVASSGALVPLGRLRNLLAESAALARVRGTPAGLQRFLVLATGVDGIVVEEPSTRAFHFRVRVPGAAVGQLALVNRLVRAEKPAATTCEVVVDP